MSKNIFKIFVDKTSIRVSKKRRILCLRKSYHEKVIEKLLIEKFARQVSYFTQLCTVDNGWSVSVNLCDIEASFLSVLDRYSSLLMNLHMTREHLKKRWIAVL
jgi:hypothetical protein